MLYRAWFCQYVAPGRPSVDLVPLAKALATLRGTYSAGVWALVAEQANKQETTKKQ
jgi:hypothetical protein